MEQACIAHWNNIILLRQMLLQIGAAELLKIGASVFTIWGRYC